MGRAEGVAAQAWRAPAGIATDEQAAATPAGSPAGGVWGWYAVPLAWLLGSAFNLVASGVWPVPWVGALMAVGGLSLALVVWLSRAAMRGRSGPLHFGRAGRLAMLALSLMLLAAGLTAWRTAVRAQAIWPTDLAPGRAQALVRIDSLPTPLAFGGWQLDADVLAWSPANQAPAGPRRSPHAWGAEPVGPAGLGALARVNRVRLYWPAGNSPVPGDTWRVDARWHRPDGVLNPGGPDLALLAWERGTGAVGQANVNGVVLEAAARWWTWHGCWDRWRAALRSGIQARVADQAAAGVLAGLTVGDQSAVEADDWDVFRRTGVAHLISISGSHIAVVGWWVAWLVRRRWGRSHRLAHVCPAHQAAMLAACMACVAYALLAGWGLPAQRTVWSMLALTALRWGGRTWPWPLTSLWVMAVVTLLDPWALWQPGFWLSFLCVMVLMTVGDGDRGTDAAVDPAGTPQAVSTPSHARRWLNTWWQAFRQLGRVQVMLSVAMAPVAVLCFHQVSVAGVLVNLVAVPMFDLVVTPLALLGIACPLLWQLDACVLNAAMKALTWVSTWPWAVTAWPAPPTWLGMWAVCTGLLWCWPGPRGWRWGWALAMLPVLILPPAWRLLPAPGDGQFTALAIDVGQGTAVLVRTRSHALLFDTGPRLGDHDDAGHRHIVPLLETLGQSRLDVLALSHEDSDHVGGAASVLTAVSVARVVGSLPSGHPLRATVPSPGAPAVPYTDCVAGQVWVWEGVKFEWLHPLRAGADGDPNAHACVLRVQAQAPALGAGRAGSAPAPSLLLTADIEAAQEAALVQAHAPLQATVLVAPHHGSATSSTEAFLGAVQPRQIVVQAGARNRYGHPAPQVTARYGQLALPWVATPACGAWWWHSAEAPPRTAAPGVTPVTPGEAQPVVGHCWRTDHPHPWTAALVSADS